MGVGLRFRVDTVPELCRFTQVSACDYMWDGKIVELMRRALASLLLALWMTGIGQR